MTASHGQFKLGTPERKALDQALMNVPNYVRRSFYRRFKNYENAYTLRMRWVQENADKDGAAREIWTAFIKERLK